MIGHLPCPGFSFPDPPEQTLQSIEPGPSGTSIDAPNDPQDDDSGHVDFTHSCDVSSDPFEGWAAAARSTMDSQPVADPLPYAVEVPDEAQSLLALAGGELGALVAQQRQMELYALAFRNWPPTPVLAVRAPETADEAVSTSEPEPEPMPVTGAAREPESANETSHAASAPRSARAHAMVQARNESRTMSLARVQELSAHPASFRSLVDGLTLHLVRPDPDAEDLICSVRTPDYSTQPPISAPRVLTPRAWLLVKELAVDAMRHPGTGWMHQDALQKRLGPGGLSAELTQMKNKFEHLHGGLIDHREDGLRKWFRINVEALRPPSPAFLERSERPVKRQRS
ncbi:hypothetical protein [Ramlibacter sp.]|uniref:hypothetical protein n=1 Tax=Ramlibacter sp. TaxID=1917967 RepID=UPI003D0BF49D